MGDCIAPGTCNDAGSTGPADEAACVALFSDSGSCSDSSLTNEADCIAPGTCNDAGSTGPADEAACVALFSTTDHCVPPSCSLTQGTDCSVDLYGHDTGCTYTAPVPSVDVDPVSGFCSDSAATYHAPSEAMCSDTSLTTEADCLAVGTCNDIGATNPVDEAACVALFSDDASSVAAEWTVTNTWTAAVVESCTDCTGRDLSPRASSASTFAASAVMLAAILAQNF